MDIKIPEERIGVLVGPGGSIKHLIEEKTKTTLEIDSETGTVSIASAEDPLQGLRVMDLVRAIGRGFSPERALAILDDEMLMLDVLDISKMASTKSDMERIKIWLAELIPQPAEKERDGQNEIKIISSIIILFIISV